MNLRCWLFGHEWLHLDTHISPERKLHSAHVCDRCDAERMVVMDVWYLHDEDEDLPDFEDALGSDGDPPEDGDAHD